MWYYYSLAMRQVAHLDRQSWFFVLMAVVIVGEAFACRPRDQKDLVPLDRGPVQACSAS